MAWSTYIKVAAAAFVGKLLVVVFVAVSVLIGFGPDKWASFLLEGFPSWVTPGKLRTAVLILAALVLVQLVWPLLSQAIDVLPGIRKGRRSIMIAGLALFISGVVAAAIGVKLIYAASNKPNTQVVSVLQPSTTQVTSAPSEPPPSPSGPMTWFGNLAMEGGPLQGRNVASLQFMGINSSKKEVKLKDAYIVSANAGEKIQLEIAAGNELVPLDEIGFIPPNARVTLFAKFGPPAPEAGKVLGLDAKEFLETWSSFTLVVVDDTQEYRLPFPEQSLIPFFPGMLGPRVTRLKK
jgi:hypothetical protein